MIRMLRNETTHRVGLDRTAVNKISKIIPSRAYTICPRWAVLSEAPLVPSVLVQRLYRVLYRRLDSRNWIVDCLSEYIVGVTWRTS